MLISSFHIPFVLILWILIGQFVDPVYAQHCSQYREGSSDWDASPRTQDRYRRYHACLKRLSSEHVIRGEFEKADLALQELLQSPGYRRTELEEEQGMYFTRDILWRWLVLMRRGKIQEARKLIEEHLRDAKCYLHFGRYLNSELDESELFERLRLQGPCHFPGAATEALAHFWVGERFLLRGDTKMAHLHLKRFLEAASSFDGREERLSRSQLGILGHIRPHRTPTKNCACAR